MTAGGIIGGSLVLGGGVAATGTGTIVGAPIGWAVGGGIVVGGLIGGGAVAAYDYFFGEKNNNVESSSVNSSENSSTNTNAGTRRKNRVSAPCKYLPIIL